MTLIDPTYGEQALGDHCEDKSPEFVRETDSLTALIEAPTPTATRADDSPPLPHLRGAMRDVIAGYAPVYAAGSLHGPVYDAHGDRIPSPAPPVVGTLTPDGKLEPLAGRHRSAA